MTHPTVPNFPPHPPLLSLDDSSGPATPPTDLDCLSPAARRRLDGQGRPMHSLELKAPPVALTLLLGGLAAGADRLLPAARVAVPGAELNAAGLALAGMVVATLGVISFRKARTTVNPLQPENASALVVTGIYRVTRNPMYVGLLLVLLGWSVFLRNPVTLVFPALFVAYMNRFQIHPEERALSARFGSAFDAYRSRVRRWL